ncbi:MAG: biotin--[acetyl-CoA-carboxylase] ligase [Ruminococcus sp.]|nr:biotin--[acetyl-CoA-carboxylase] ligase [Ruminococcus sp.]
MKSTLDEKEVRRLAKGCGYDIHTVDEIDSTNNELKRLAAEGKPGGYLLAASRQTAGRGRLGRSFFSPKSGVYLSLLLRPETTPDRTLFLTTAAAVAVCRAIESVSDERAEIKWVNDVYISKRKVCGILTEASVSGSLTEWAVVGIGVNITPPEGGFPEEIADRAGAIFNGGNAPDGFENRLTAAIALELERVYLQTHSVTAQEYRSRSLIIGKRITVVNGAERLYCRAVDVDDEARLEVEYDDGRRAKLFSGEVERVILK